MAQAVEKRSNSRISGQTSLAKVIDNAGMAAAETVDPGHDPGAPERTRLWTKVAVTTALAMVLTVLIHFAVEADLVSFRRPA